MPYRSAGYESASHERRHLSVSADRSRSVSPQARNVSANGMSSSSVNRGINSATPSPHVKDSSDTWRPPHRTQALSTRSSSRTRQYDSDYEDTHMKHAGENRQYSDELHVNTKGHSLTTEKRHYIVSPRSIGSAGESLSGSDLDSPNVRDSNVDEVHMDVYHAKRSTNKPRMDRDHWIY